MAAARVPVLLGPTAVGKTAVALALAEYWPLEVISADSRQVYRRLDVATAKPSAAERLRVPHHGLDLIDPGERYSAGRFARDAATWVPAVRERGRIPVVVGGTGLYVRAVTGALFDEPPLEPVRRDMLGVFTAGLALGDLRRWAARLDPACSGGGRQRAARAIEVALLSGRPLSMWQALGSERARWSIEPWYILLTLPRPLLHERIARRADAMVRNGLIEEVASVLADGFPADAPGLDGIGVRQAVQHLHGHRSRDSVAEAIALSTRQYAKRQETWFRHQLGGEVLALDGTRSPDRLAVEITRAWSRAARATPCA